MRKIMLALAATSMAAPVAIPAPASAQGYYQGKTWRDSRGVIRCRKPNGTVGTIVGAAGGALIGRAVDTRGERATGTIIGAAAGALVGRHIQRNSGGRRCR